MVLANYPSHSGWDKEFCSNSAFPEKTVDTAILIHLSPGCFQESPRESLADCKNQLSLWKILLPLFLLCRDQFNDFHQRLAFSCTLYKILTKNKWTEKTFMNMLLPVSFPFFPLDHGMPHEASLILITLFSFSIESWHQIFRGLKHKM